MKRGHHDPPRAVVVGAVDRQEAVAEEWDQVAEARLAPVELLGVLDRDVRVRLGAEHEHGLGVEQARREDRPVLALEREQDRERVVRDRARAREAEVARPGRELALRLALHQMSPTTRPIGLWVTRLGAGTVDTRGIVTDPAVSCRPALSLCGAVARIG